MVDSLELFLCYLKREQSQQPNSMARKFRKIFSFPKQSQFPASLADLEQKSTAVYTVGRLLSGHPSLDFENWPLVKNIIEVGRLIEVQYKFVEMAVDVVLLTLYSKMLVEKCAYVKINANIIVKKQGKCPLFARSLLFTVVGCGVVTRISSHLPFRQKGPVRSWYT